MTRRVNFADPEYEPTDEDLLQLVREAFAGVAEQRRRVLAQMRERVAARRAEVLARLRSRVPRAPEQP